MKKSLTEKRKIISLKITLCSWIDNPKFETQENSTRFWNGNNNGERTENQRQLIFLKRIYYRTNRRSFKPKCRTKAGFNPKERKYS
jgi:hypothetical protein